MYFKKNFKKVVSLLIGLFMLVNLTACSSSKNSTEKISEVKIGAILPLTGPASTTGKTAKDGMDLAVDIINGKYDDINLPFAKEEGLPGLGGAKLKIVYSDTQGAPEKAQTIMEKLVNDEKVAAVEGAYHSSVVAAAAIVAERYGVPFVSGDATSPALTQKGYKWFFRTCPDDTMIADGFYKFMADMNTKYSANIKNIDLIAENTLWGTDSSKIEKTLASNYNYNVKNVIPYDSKASEFSSEIMKVKADAPDAVIHSSYVADSIMMIKQYKQMDYAPVIFGNGGGFVDPSFIKTLGKDSEYLITRTCYNNDVALNADTIAKIEKLFFDKYGYNMVETSARDFENTLILADAINRAKSVDPNAIRQALVETNIPKSDLIVSYEGVKFNDKQQNELASVLVVQIQNGKYTTVWPWDRAKTEVEWPIPTWSKR